MTFKNTNVADKENFILGRKDIFVNRIQPSKDSFSAIAHTVWQIHNLLHACISQDYSTDLKSLA